MPTPVFMVGEQRSGSNLLRLMLNQSAELAAPHPPHLLQRLLPLLSSYGDLNEPARFARLIDDACCLVERNPVAWEGIDRFDREDIRARCRSNDLFAVFGAIMDTYAEAQGKGVWLCKSMTNIRHAEQLDRLFDGPRYIYLHRDGRDVALSFMTAVVGHKHAYHIARDWADLQRTCLRERERIGPARFHTVSYEELTANPEPVLRDLCAFLQIDYSPAMTRFSQSDEAVRTAASSDLWSNVTRPLLKTNSRKFMRLLPEDDIRIFESVAGTELDELGYERVCIRAGQERTFTPEEIRRFDRENVARKAVRRASMDADDAARRQRQEDLLEEIQGRGVARQSGPRCR